MEVAKGRTDSFRWRVAADLLGPVDVGVELVLD
jgi:hypothetical protein